MHGCLFCLPDNQKKASRLSQGLVFQSWNNNEEEEEEVVVVVVEEEEEEEDDGLCPLTEFCNHFSFVDNFVDLSGWLACWLGVMI